jgi:hypothetical protein
MKTFPGKHMRSVAISITLALAGQGCMSRATPDETTIVPAADRQAEAKRLVRTLDMSTHLQDSAREYAAKAVARGIAPKKALELWIAEQRDRGAVTRCKAEVSPTEECIART